MSKGDLNALLRKIFRDMEVEFTDEFDRNFERQSFFGEAWKRRRSPVKDRGRGLLIDSGGLRGSLRTKISRTGITFIYDKDYASIHNEGGEIRVTKRMKRFFWAKYYSTSGSFSRRKDGSLRRDQRNSRLTTEADFWRMMALKPEGSVIRIPRRQFIGNHPEIEKSAREIIIENTDAFLRDNFGDIKIDIRL